MEGKQEIVGLGIVLAILLLGTIVIALDWGEVTKMVSQADLTLLPLILLWTFLSYFCLSLGFAVLNELFGITMKRKDLLEVGFVSFTAGYLISMAGITSYSLRVLLMKKRGLGTGDVLAASFFHSYLNSIVMVGLMPIGLSQLLATHTLDNIQKLGLFLVLLVMMIVLVGATMILFSRNLKNTLFYFFEQGIFLLLHKSLNTILDALSDTMERGISAIRGRPHALIFPLILSIADWGSCVAALFFCFDAFGDPVTPGILLTGFSLGIIVGILSMVPGGLGIQEGTMSWVFSLFGVPLEHAILATVLFRVTYYFIPFVVSLPLYRRLLR